jgi:hypothetical protein
LSLISDCVLGIGVGYFRRDRMENGTGKARIP